MKPMKIFIFSIALCLMACAVPAGDIHGVEDEASVEPMVPELPSPISIGDQCKEDIAVIAGIQYGGETSQSPTGSQQNMKGIVTSSQFAPIHENTHTHGLDIKPRVNEAHEVDIESHMMQLHNEASGIQKEAPQIRVEDIIHEIEPPEDEGVTLVITFDNTPPSALATEHL